MRFLIPLIYNLYNFKSVSYPINEITLIQYGMSMNFYNKLGDIWVIKVLDFHDQELEISNKKVLDKGGIIFGDSKEGHPVPRSPAQSHFFN